MITMKDTLCATSAEVPDIEAEMIWAKIETSEGNSAFVDAYYRPPSDSSPNTIENPDTVLNSLDTDSPIILSGDFSAGDIDSECNLVKPGIDRKDLCERLIETLDEHHIERLQREPTRQGALLDLYCTNRPGLVTSIDTVPGISDHDIVVVDTKIKARLTKKPRRPDKQWSKADWDTIRKETTTFRDKFLSEYQERDVDTNYSDFQQHVDDMLDKHVPTKLSSSRKNVPWLTLMIRRMCRKKQRLYNHAKKVKKNKDRYWGQYCAHQTSTSKALRKAKWDYINGILQESLNEGNSKPFWLYIYSQKNDSKGVAPLKEDGSLFTDSRTKTDMLNTQFVSVFTRDTPGSDTLLHGPSYPPI